MEVALPPKVVRREAAAQEALPRVAAAHVVEAILRESRAEAAVAQPVTRMTIIHRAAVVVEEGDKLF